jgi:nucleoside-triphosphatase THEP1
MLEFMDALSARPAQRHISGVTPPELVILTGPSGAGKSTACLRFAARARAAGHLVGGLISIPVFAGGTKVAIDFVDQLHHEKRRVAVRNWGMENDLATEKWSFDAQVLAWGNDLLHDLPACDFVIIDELGPLEFERGRGLTAGLDLLDRHDRRGTLVVIRPSLLDEARRRWPWGEALVLPDRGEL